MKDFITPIVKSSLSTNENEIYIKREDLLPFCFGGNKVRIAKSFIDDMYKKNKNYMIGYGSTKSNLSRALACMCSAKKIPCTIISSISDNLENDNTYNSYIVSKVGADIISCNTKNVAETVKKVVDDALKIGFDPYYIYGNEFGEGNEAVPVGAYVPVYDEILYQQKSMGLCFDYIFLGCGTGMTYSGLLCGKLAKNGQEKIVGISIARDQKSEIPKLKKMLLSYADQNELKFDSKCINDSILFTDEYLCGGYSKYNNQIENIIEYEMKYDGISFDTTYTGKAFWGMNEYIKNNNIRGKKILFIHTGATTLYFDYLNKMMINSKKDSVTECKDINLLIDFLNKIDSKLPIQLSARVEINSYAKKITENGKILAIYNEEFEIVSAVLFYCNDMRNREAYVTLLGTIDGYEGNGYGKMLMNSMLEFVRKLGMKRIHLDTDRTNLKAIKFYEKLGYRIDGEMPKIHMIKEIV